MNADEGLCFFEPAAEYPPWVSLSHAVVAASTAALTSFNSPMMARVEASIQLLALAIPIFSLYIKGHWQG